MRYVKNLTYFLLQLNKTESKDSNELKRTKHDSQLLESRVEDVSLKSEEIYLLKREKLALLSKLQKTKKDLADKRASVKDLEFKVLQDPQRFSKEEIKKEK